MTTRDVQSITARFTKPIIMAGNVLDVQLRGEYLYAAMGKGGFRVLTWPTSTTRIFREKMNTAPVSPLGQRLYVKTKYATAVASPSTLAIDPLRTAQSGQRRAGPSRRCTGSST